MSVRENIDVFVRDYIDERLQSAFTEATPLFYFLGINEAAKNNLLGRETGMIFAGSKVGNAEKRSLSGSEHHQFRFLKGRYGTTEGVEYGGATSTASGFTEDNFFTAQTQWSTHELAVKTRTHSFYFAEDAGDLAIGRFVEEQLAEPFDHFVSDIHDKLWTGTLSEADQAKRVWAGEYLGLQHQLTEGNVYGRRDRTAYPGLQPSAINAATDFSTGSNALLEWTRYANNGFTKANGGGAFKGLASRGESARLWVTTSDIWNDLANQADGRYQIYHSGIPGIGGGGFKQPIIQFGNCFITWDPDCPSGELYGLNLNYMCYEVHKKENFKWTGWMDNDLYTEGGEKYRRGKLQLTSRFTNRAPWRSVRIRNVTTSSI